MVQRSGAAGQTGDITCCALAPGKQVTSPVGAAFWWSWSVSWSGPAGQDRVLWALVNGGSAVVVQFSPGHKCFRVSSRVVALAVGWVVKTGSRYGLGRCVFGRASGSRSGVGCGRSTCRRVRLGAGHRTGQCEVCGVCQVFPRACIQSGKSGVRVRVGDEGSLPFRSQGLVRSAKSQTHEEQVAFRH